MTIEPITVGQVRAGQTISLREDGSLSFVVRSIRDGMRSGIGLRTTDGEYAKLPHGHTVYRVVGA